MRNRSSTTALNGVTPYECLFKKKSDVSNLRVFGCVTYVHVPDNQRKKLDAKSRKSIFVGYPEGVKGFKLYDPVTHKFTGSRDVMSLEKNFHDFNVPDSSNSDDCARDDFPIKIGKIPANENLDHDGPANRRVADDAEGNQQGGDQQVGETLKETFMNEVRNIGDS